MSRTTIKVEKPCDSTCSKCGSADVVRDLRAKGEYMTISFGAHRWIDKPWVKEINYSSYQFTCECIEHHCRGCHFEWCTEPLAATA
jgi:hypothetical protein